MRLVKRLGEAPPLDVLELIGSFGFRYLMVGTQVVFRVTASSNLRLAHAERWGNVDWMMDGTRAVLLIFDAPLVVDLQRFADAIGASLEIETDRAALHARDLRIELQLEGGRIRSMHAYCERPAVKLRDSQRDLAQRDSRP